MQLGPPPSTVKKELEPRRPSSASGTRPLDTKATLNAAANSGKGLLKEVEQAPKNFGRRSHQMASMVGQLQKAAEIVHQITISLLHGSLMSTSHPTICFLPTLPQRAEGEIASSNNKIELPASNHRP